MLSIKRQNKTPPHTQHRIECRGKIKSIFFCSYLLYISGVCRMMGSEIKTKHIHIKCTEMVAHCIGARFDNVSFPHKRNERRNAINEITGWRLCLSWTRKIQSTETVRGGGGRERRQDWRVKTIRFDLSRCWQYAAPPSPPIIGANNANAIHSQQVF